MRYIFWGFRHVGKLWLNGRVHCARCGKHDTGYDVNGMCGQCSWGTVDWDAVAGEIEQHEQAARDQHIKSGIDRLHGGPRWISEWEHWDVMNAPRGDHGQ